MKQHPTKGEHILEAVPLLKEKAGDGLMHHENVDGSGYPRGLKGDEIPLFGRIVSVADAFDAMTTDRPYSKAMTFEAAVARLRFLAGKKFDPASVDAFERAFLAGDVSPAKAAPGLRGLAPLRPQRPHRGRAPAGPARGRAARRRPHRCERDDDPRAAATLRRAALLALLAAAGLAQSPPTRSCASRPASCTCARAAWTSPSRSSSSAVKEDPKNPYFQNGPRPRVRRRSGEWKDAIAAFRKALELNPYYVDAKNALGYALIMSGDREGGKQEFLAAFSDPMNPAPEISAHNLGRAYLEEKNYAEAVNWLRTSLNRNKAYSEAYLLPRRDARGVGPRRGGGGPARGGRQGGADGRPGCSSGSARPTPRSGASRTRGRRLEEALKLDPAGPAGRAAAEQLKALPK